MSLVDLVPGQHAEQVRDHWWWREGWRVGRRFYAFHITWDQQPALAQLVATYQAALRHAPPLTIVPERWLHLTMQGIGFTDLVSRDEITDLARHAQSLLGRMAAFEASFDETVVTDEAIVLPANPPEPIQEARHLVRQAIADTLGESRVTEDPDRFRPHVSVAYLTSDGPAAPYVAALESVDARPATVRINHIDLIEMHRDNRMYEWRVVTPIQLA